jgi:phage anti-repressor protein
MPVFQIGIDISVAKTTTVLVRLNAENEKEAKAIATNELHKITHNCAKSSKLLRKIKSYEWDEDFSTFEIEGISYENYPIEQYEADLDLTKEDK